MRGDWIAFGDPLLIWNMSSVSPRELTKPIRTRNLNVSCGLPPTKTVLMSFRCDAVVQDLLDAVGDGRERLDGQGCIGNSIWGSRLVAKHSYDPKRAQLTEFLRERRQGCSSRIEYLRDARRISPLDDGIVDRRGSECR